MQFGHARIVYDLGLGEFSCAIRCKFRYRGFQKPCSPIGFQSMGDLGRRKGLGIYCGRLNAHCLGPPWELKEFSFLFHA